MMTVNSRSTPRSKFLALIRLASCVVVLLASPAAAWAQVDERDEAQRVFYLGLKFGDGSTPWGGNRLFESESSDPLLGIDGLWLVTGDNRWGIGVTATYTQFGLGATMRGVPWWENSQLTVGDGSTIDLSADAGGVALVLGRSGRLWTVYGGAGFGVVSAGASVSAKGHPDWLEITPAQYEALVRGMATYIARDRNPSHFSEAYILANDAFFASLGYFDRYSAVSRPGLPDGNGVYVVFGSIWGKPRGLNYGFTVEGFSLGGEDGGFAAANVTLGWKF